MQELRHAAAPGPARKRRKRRRKFKQIIGWREWIAMPTLGIERIKAKIDTGARTAALHAWHIERFERDGEPWVRFEVHPVQRENRTRKNCEARLAGVKTVRNSGGDLETRFAIVTEVTLGIQTWPIEVTLTNRDEMGFRMLLGRASVRGHFVVDPSTSYRARKHEPVLKRPGPALSSKRLPKETRI